MLRAVIRRDEIEQMITIEVAGARGKSDRNQAAP